MAETPIDRIERELREGLEKVTPGPWQVIVDEHPWVLPAKPEWDQPDEKHGNHIERRIATVAHHPQLHGPWPVVTSGTGVGVDKPVQFIMIDEADAHHIARCDPDTIRLLLDELPRQQKRVKSVEANAELCLNRIMEANDELDNLRAELSSQREALEKIAEAFQAAKYVPGDHPIVPVKIDAFMKAVARALLQQKGEADV